MKSDNSKWQTLSSKYVLENPWFKVRQDKIIRPNGKDGEYNVIECCESVFVAPITPSGKILLVKLFRYPTQRVGWEVPAGGIDPGEPPLAAAKRELAEETGLSANGWQEIGKFNSMNGTSNSAAHIFEAKEFSEQGKHEQEEEGIIEVCAFSIGEILKMIQDGQIIDALSTAALSHYFIKQNMIKP